MIRQINTTASSEVMCGIETRVILELFDKFEREREREKERERERERETHIHTE